MTVQARAAPLTEGQKAHNREKPRVRARGGRLVCTIGLKRAEVKAGLLKLAYNMRRLARLEALAARRPGAAMPAAA